MILAVVVTYNPDIERLKENINSIINQVDKILVVDNASKNVEEIEKIFLYEKIKILKNKKNFGIAVALNEGLNYANSNRYKFILTLDQDSISSNNMVEILKKGFEKDKNISIVSPSIFDLNVNEIMTNKIDDDYKEVEWTITSGSLCSVEDLLKVGGFDNNLFIDCVDKDICLKLLLNNQKIYLSKAAILNHEVGNMEIKKFFGITFNVTNHSAFRIYYIFRNNLFINYKYQNNSFKGKLKLFKRGVGVILYEKNKLEKLKMIKKAIKDYRNMLKNRI